MDLPQFEILPFQLQTDGFPEPKNDPFAILEYQDLNNRHLWLDGEINWDNCAFCIRYIQYLNRMDNSKNPKPIHIHIMSGGGDLATMFAVYNTIKNSKIPIYTYNEGAAHSAAFIIFLAGHKRFANKYSVSIAHEGSAELGGSYRETKASMKAYERSVQKMREIIADSTDYSPDEIEKHYDESQDWYIYYDEMVERGIVTDTLSHED